MSKTYQISLVQSAKSAGGDKYSIPLEKESFIYVPQNISRVQGVAHSKLELHIRTVQTGEEGEMAFTLLKQGKTGDDRYTPSASSELLWKGDVYFSQEFRNESKTIYLSITP
jgi:hypothetical protein